MMLIEQIDADLKTALKEKNEVAVSSLRNIKSALKNSEIEKQSALTDDEALKVLAKKVKQHKDSIESFKVGNRNDLVEREQAQMLLLEKYMPQALGEQELAVIVEKTISTLNATVSDFGKVMKDVVNQVKGQADGNLISKIVKEKLK